MEGTKSGQVVVWDTQSGKKAKDFAPHRNAVNSVDISPDGKTFATSSEDRTTNIWSLPANKWLRGRKDADFYSVKFSPNGWFYACAFGDESIGVGLDVRDSQSGDLHSRILISVRSFAWARDSNQLYILSDDSRIHTVDVNTSATVSTWPIHDDRDPGSISLSSNGAFIAVSANSSVSFWDSCTHQQIGFIIQHPGRVNSMAIFQDYHLAIAGGSDIALWSLRHVLPSPYTEDHVHCKMTEVHLNETIQSLRKDLAIQNIKSVMSRHPRSSANLEETVRELRIQLTNSGQKVDGLTKILYAHRQKHECETLYAGGRVIDAAKSLLDIKSSVNDDVKSDATLMNWLSDFSSKCLIALEGIGDTSSGNHDQALVAYASALRLCTSSPRNILTKWASIMLVSGPTMEVLDAADKFGIPRFVTYRVICDVLEGGGRTAEAAMCFRQMQSELTTDTCVDDERLQWELSFRRRCTERLETFIGTALGSQNYNEVDCHLSTILLLDPLDRVDVLIKRSKTRAMMKSWEGSLTDADEAIRLDPSSHLGYERRHAALHGAGHYAEATAAFDTMLSKLVESPDARTRELRSQYTDARSTIRHIIHGTISRMPRVLIDTTTGHLLDRSAQAEVFETLPIFNKLVSSMTLEVDRAWIWREVKEFYRYVMLSHKWGHGEPLFQKVKLVTVYKLQVSPANTKLRTFCEIAHSLGFRWAWSDTCCIDKANNVVLQESLVAMYAWYRDSTLTIIHLCDVSSGEEDPDALKNCIWNSRVWTYQEYVAAERVMFYTLDWKPYRGLTLENHKESPDVLREMEVPQVSAEQVAILRPGLNRVREKLHLASRRQTSLEEDVAYSLLGIFHAPIPVIYGEGTRAVGRLLEYVLTGSGDVTILAWTGTANEYHSCLPMNLTVYDSVVPPHIPHIESAELDQIVTGLYASLPDLSFATTLNDQLNGLASVTLVSSRLRLPCVRFPITELVRASGPDARSNLWTYIATTSVLGDIEIKTTHDLTVENEHCFVHPWIRPLLRQEYSRGITGLDKTTRALRLVARLRQAFGALLFEKVSWMEYRRVAADSLIMVQVRSEVPLTDLIGKIETMEVL